MPTFYIGLMSGTSMDGIDGVLVDFPASAPVVVAHVHQPFQPALRGMLWVLNSSGPNELHHAALAANGIALAYAEVVSSLLKRTGLHAENIVAVGAHGQTVRHQPGLHDGIGYTVQLLNGAVLAERAGIDVVCDFRSRDVAAGGQGAPLVPAFHRAMFATPGRDHAVLNIGGIANITLLHADGRTGGHDCGPGNALLDLWCQAHTGQPFDTDGRWAATGQPIASLLRTLMAEPYFNLPPPKSTGRDLFNRTWLEARMQEAESTPTIWRPEDVQATLVQFTARSIGQDLKRWMPQVHQVMVCGGGALNSHLMQAIAHELPGVTVGNIQQFDGTDPMHVEATAFAWLAHCFVHRISANCTDVTGAVGPRVLGALHPA